MRVLPDSETARMDLKTSSEKYLEERREERGTGR